MINKMVNLSTEERKSKGAMTEERKHVSPKHDLLMEDEDVRDALNEVEERTLLLQDVVENIRNDSIGVSQEIQMVDPIVEKEIFFEDILGKDRLNDDIDIDDDVRIRSLFDNI